MQHFAKVAVFVLVLSFAAATAAQDYELGFEAYKRGDYAAALREFRPLADQGHAKAQFKLGAMYLLSQGVPQDLVLARLWLDLAAGQGNETAYIISDDVAGFMTPAQIAEAEKFAREWRLK